jgi:fluoride exporter
VTAGLWLGIAVLGGTGALLRFGLTELVSAHLGRAFPLGTLAVNGSGSFFLGLLAGLDAGDDAYLLAGTALLGSYTTFSTWMLETERLAEERRGRAAAANIAFSAALGLGAVALGRLLGGRL